MRVSSLLLAGLAPALACAQLQTLNKLADLTEGAVKKGLGLFLNESQIEAISREYQAVPHKYAADLTDDNWQAVIKTGTVNPLATPLDPNTTWVIHVYGKDQTSQLMARPFDAVANDNSSFAGGSLPASMRFARISYEKETVLTTRLWIWKAPVIVITDPNFREIRYFKIGQILPRQDAMSALLAAPEVWTTKPVWTGRFAPGGKYEYILVKYADFAAWWHKYLSKVPNVVWVMLSGAIMNLVLGFFHSKEQKEKEDKAKQPQIALTREQQRAALKERLAKEKREKEAAEKEEADRLELERLEAERVAQEEAEATTLAEGEEGSTATRPRTRACQRK